MPVASKTIVEGSGTAVLGTSDFRSWCSGSQSASFWPISERGRLSVRTRGSLLRPH